MGDGSFGSPFPDWREHDRFSRSQSHKDFGKDLKTRKSPSFEVEAGEARQLEAQGLVSLAGKIEVIKEPDGGAPDSGTKPKQKAKSDGSIDKDA